MSKCSKTTILSLAVLAVLAAAIPASAATYYWNGARGDFCFDSSKLTKWWTNPGGTGTNPASTTELLSSQTTLIVPDGKGIGMTVTGLAAGSTLNVNSQFVHGTRPTDPWNATAALTTTEFCVENGTNPSGTYYWRDLRLQRGYASGYRPYSRHWTGHIWINGPFMFEIRNGNPLYIDAEVDASGEPNMYVYPFSANAGGYPSTAALYWQPSVFWFYGKWAIRGHITGSSAGAFGESDIQLYAALPVGAPGYDNSNNYPGTIQIANADALSTNARIDMMTATYGTASTPLVSKIVTNLATPVTIRWATMNGVDIPAGTYSSATAIASNGQAWIQGSGSVTISGTAQQNLTMVCGDPNSKTYPPIGTTKAYVQGRVVRIKAVNDTTSSWVFDHWSSSTGGGIASTTLAETTVTIPTGEDITVTAHYTAAAGSPMPATGSAAVSTYTDLSWVPVSSGVTSQDVYFGTDNPPATLVGSGVGLSSLTNAQIGGPLADNTTYYWMVRTNGFDGGFWSFTTGSSTPHSPTPADVTTEINADTTLTWVADSAATSYDVYLSTDQALVSSGDPSVKTTVTSASLPVTGLTRGVYYYWKTVANYSGGVTRTGPVWSFKVKTFKLYLRNDLVPPRYSLDGGADVNAVLDDANMAVFKFASLDLNSQWDIVVTGTSRKGVAIWSDADINFGGLLDVSAPNYVIGTNAGTPKAGGYIGQPKSADLIGWADVSVSGPGRGTKKINPWPGGGGGGYGGIGGDYGYRDTTGGWGGVTYGEQQLYTLWGGSGGGGSLDGPAGSGGGIVEFYAKGNIAIGSSAVIRSNGGSADNLNSRCGQGGGSGGSIRLVAAGNVSIDGTITANGGEGANALSQTNQGGGGGGGGRIAVYHGGAYTQAGTVTTAGGVRGNVASTAATDGAAGTVYTTGNPATLIAANNQYPANNAIGVSITDPNYNYIAWNPALGSTSNTLYFGTSEAGMSLVATYADANGLRLRRVYRPALAEATQYYWRVDTDGETGTLMTFRSQGREAHSPSPADGATGVDVHNPRLSWQMYTSSATKWEAYFGTSEASLTLKKTITDPNALLMYYDAGEMLASKTYYWRVDETSNQKWTGFIWSFTTRAATCPAANKPIADLSGDCKVTFLDMALLASQWKVCNLYPATDCQ